VDWYASAIGKAFNAEIDLDDNMTATLHTSAYALDRFVNDYVNDLTNELPTAAGYTVGGVSVGAITRTLTTANAWSLARANGATYAVGDVVRPAAGNGFLYRAVVGGVAAGAPPAFPTVLGQTVADGAVTWECYARAITVFLCTTAPTWATATFTARYCVISDRTQGAAAAQALVAVADFGTDLTGGGGPFTVNPHPQLGNFHVAHH
jgi:hypothetical protein